MDKVGCKSYCYSLLASSLPWLKLAQTIHRSVVRSFARSTINVVPMLWILAETEKGKLEPKLKFRTSF